MKKIIVIGLIAFTALLTLSQFVPITRANPPVTREIQWQSEEARQLAERACYACHSNETEWPWYSNLAPVSWLVSGHVKDGREHLNFSEWDRPNEDLDKILEVLEEGEMPLASYVLMHSEAKLSDAETEALMNGLVATFEHDPPIIDENHDHEDEDDHYDETEDDHHDKTEGDHHDEDEDDHHDEIEDDHHDETEDDHHDEAEDDHHDENG